MEHILHYHYSRRLKLLRWQKHLDLIVAAN